MSAVQIRYVGPMLHADVPILGRQGEPLDDHGEGCVVRGEVFDCDKTVAGRPPKLDDDGALELDDDGQPVDAGEGLLAQVGVFEVADAKKGGTRRSADSSPPTPPASTTDNAATGEGSTR